MREADLLSIGELARHTGVATSALRYYEDRGLLRPAARVQGRRRYRSAAVTVVGAILLLRDLGFRLDEIRAFMATRKRSPRAWRDHARSKVAQLDAHIARLSTAWDALAHAVVDCQSDDIAACPIFQSVVDARLAGVGQPEADPALTHCDGQTRQGTRSLPSGPETRRVPRSAAAGC